MKTLLLADMIAMLGVDSIVDNLKINHSVNITGATIKAWSRKRRTLVVKPVLVNIKENGEILDIFVCERSLIESRK